MFLEHFERGRYRFARSKASKRTPEPMMSAHDVMPSISREIFSSAKAAIVMIALGARGPCRRVGFCCLPKGQRNLVWLAGAGLVATRIVLLAHWTSDVLAGLILGAASERLVRRLTGFHC